MTVAKSPVPQEVSDELARVVQRWRQLPLDHAQSCMPSVRLLVESLAGEPVPDLGPGVVMDQLTVMVFDACAAGRCEELSQRLADLRRSL
jgi:hypothetical protein